MDKTKILIADDHRMFRTGVAHLLKKEEQFEIIAEASCGTNALELAIELDIDIILMDINIPGIDGIAATSQILQIKPGLKILALSSFDDEDRIVQMVKAGAKGYLLKSASIAELIQAIKTVKEGNSYFSKLVSDKIFSRLEKDKRPAYGAAKKINGNSITQREYEILQYVFDEMNNREIAERLYISPRTVETHKRNLIKKLKVKNAVGLIKYYFTHINNLQKEELAS